MCVPFLKSVIYNFPTILNSKKYASKFVGIRRPKSQATVLDKGAMISFTESKINKRYEKLRNLAFTNYLPIGEKTSRFPDDKHSPSR